MRNHLPAEYEKIEFTADTVPYQRTSPAYPFTGFVLNINVRTQGHRDKMDDILCLVFTFGDFTDGHLVLYELGLVVELKHGNFILFRSSEQTHFNLDYIGIRGSLVLHSDKSLQRWAENANGHAGGPFAPPHTRLPHHLRFVVSD